MKRIIALVLLGICGTALQAAPLVFTDTLYLTDALALAGIANDTQSDSSPPTAFPLLKVAAADTDTGLSEFIGNFVAPIGAIRLSFNFDTNNNGSDGTAAESSILLTLIADGETFLNEVFNTAQFIDRFIVLPVGALATLDLLLTSSADATAGDALAVATLTFQATQVPVAPTLVLMLMGLLALAYRLRRS
jgi:hypothetical protein